MSGIKVVGFKQYYDLVFRARNAKLGPVHYELDFLTWVKAGIAYNTRGCELGTRKIAMFAELFMTLQEAVDCGAGPIREKQHKFSDALIYFYEDIYAIYQDHLASVQANVRFNGLSTAPKFNEVLILPSFRAVPWLTDVFTRRDECLSTYESKSECLFLESINSSYLPKSTDLYKAMALMFDYGPEQMGRDVLLEVTL